MWEVRLYKRIPVFYKYATLLSITMRLVYICNSDITLMVRSHKTHWKWIAKDYQFLFTFSYRSNPIVLDIIVHLSNTLSLSYKNSYYFRLLDLLLSFFFLSLFLCTLFLSYNNCSSINFGTITFLDLIH